MIFKPVSKLTWVSKDIDGVHLQIEANEKGAMLVAVDLKTYRNIEVTQYDCVMDAINHCKFITPLKEESNEPKAEEKEAVL